MTAEIGILNRYGVALAADSAVTVTTNSGKQKVLNSANKLFNLIKGFPVGVMVYGDGSFMGVPWEVIIDDYRKNFGTDNEFNNLQEYANSFFKIDNFGKFNSTEGYINLTINNLSSYIEAIVENTKQNLSKKFPNREINQEEAKQEFCEILRNVNIKFEKLEFADGFSESDIEIIKGDEENLSVVKFCLKSTVLFDITDDLISSVAYLNALIQCKDIYNNYAGIVFSGYGYSEIFPSLYQYKVYGIINGKLKYKLEKETCISSSPILGGNIAEIIPFAQQEMVQTVLRGMDPDLHMMLQENLKCFLDNLEVSAKNILNCNDCDNINNNIDNLMEQSRKNIYDMMNFIDNKAVEAYTNPVISMVASLPKDELAAMAETLVNLTSFKRKITMDAETVGGPIDVAIISKSEGFIWMKRKLYFSKELNQNYYNNHK